MEDGMLTSAEITAAFTPAPRPTVAWVELDGEAVLFDEDSGTLNLLDPIGAVVWSCLDGQTTIAELADDLASVYGADRAVIQQDVLRLARELGDLHLLQGVKGAEPDGSGAVAEGGPTTHGRPEGGSPALGNQVDGEARAGS